MRDFKVVEPILGDSTNRIAKKTKELNLDVIAGIVKRAKPDVLYDSAFLIDKNGLSQNISKDSHISTNQKYIRCWKLPVFDTDVGKIRYLICYDLEFSETARVPALQGGTINLSFSD